MAGLSACAEPGPGVIPPTPPPLTAQIFAGAAGSVRGNYPAIMTDETVPSPFGSSVAPCAVFVWDRPMPGGWALRNKSASCPVPGKPPGAPGSQAPYDLGQSYIPLADSTLAHGWDMPPEPDRPPTAPNAHRPEIDRGL
jgi:hypothetical protein